MTDLQKNKIEYWTYISQEYNFIVNNDMQLKKSYMDHSNRLWKFIKEIWEYAEIIVIGKRKCEK